MYPAEDAVALELRCVCVNKPVRSCAAPSCPRTVLILLAGRFRFVARSVFLKQLLVARSLVSRRARISWRCGALRFVARSRFNT